MTAWMIFGEICTIPMMFATQLWSLPIFAANAFALDIRPSSMSLCQRRIL